MASFQSNEEIIENLTKNLSKSFIEPETHTESSSNSLNNQNDDLVTQDDRLSVEDEGENKTPDNSEENEDDSIDEASLQDRDAQLSSEDKENFMKEALKYKNEGNVFFKSGEYFESILSYTKGLKLCPLDYTNDRSILFSNRAASKQKLGRKEAAIQDCAKAIELNSNYVKAYLRRAVLYEETDKLDESLEDYKKILELDPGNRDAVAANMRLPNLINERNEKLKAEMMDKLKDLGNMVLRPFGLSTENFKMTKDPNSGGYSINFVQNQ